MYEGSKGDCDDRRAGGRAAPLQTDYLALTHAGGRCAWNHLACTHLNQIPFFFLHITQNINGSEALKKSIGGENGDHGVQNLNKRTNDFNITN